MHCPEHVEVLAQHFTGEGVGRIVKFLEEKKLSPSGEMIVVSIFLFAKQRQNTIVKIFFACNREWEANWKSQRPEVRGDPDAPDTVGTQNCASFVNICQTLGIANPVEGGRRIPKEALVIKTGSSIYTIGPADDKGERDIAKDGEVLPFTRCRVTFILQGKPLKVIMVDGSSPGKAWGTSDVESIAPVESSVAVQV